MGFLFSGHGRIRQRWSYDAKSTIVSGPALAVIDGKQCTIFGTKDGRVLCLGEEGEEAWSFQAGERLAGVDAYFVDAQRVHSIDAPPVVADVDADGEPEVLVGSELGIVYCLSAQGRLRWKHDCGGSVRSGIAVADINMDGKQEILVCSMNNRLTALTGEGKRLFEYDTDAPLQSVPGVLRTARGTLIIFGADSGILTAITPAQEVAWKVHLKHGITAAPVFFSDPEERRMAIGTTGGSMFCISEHGEVVWEYKTEGSIYNAASIADINQDERLEIVFASCDNTVYALTTEGRRCWSYETDFWVTATPLITDLNGDGKLEVVAGSYDQNLYVLDGQGTYVLDYMPGLSAIVNQSGHYSTILTSDPGEQTGKQLFRLRLGSLIVGCSLLESQGRHGVVVTTKNGQVAAVVYER